MSRDNKDEKLGPQGFTVDGVTISERQSYASGYRIHKATVGARHTYVMTRPDGTTRQFAQWEDAYRCITREVQGPPEEVAEAEHPHETPIRDKVRERIEHEGRTYGFTTP